jgi:hypothetical protein
LEGGEHVSVRMVSTLGVDDSCQGSELSTGPGSEGKADPPLREG